MKGKRGIYGSQVIVRSLSALKMSEGLRILNCVVRNLAYIITWILSSTKTSAQCLGLLTISVRGLETISKIT